VARVTGYSQHWVRVIVKRYNHAGPDDTRHRNPGAASLLTNHQLQLLEQALLSPPPDGGMWNGAKVAEWVSHLLGRKVYPQRGWELLGKLDYRLRRPRPRHARADAAAQIEWYWKKTERSGRRR
jgi:transposase